ncbi:hypothetical protein BRADI_3g23074v3 [Brachypodium distachyon]|uniref:Uncharacterized protein n=1 Tax=Brachypodium distachyon TaxID=15368 RepID=A0A2K2CYY2_BRADI|nr:hypothetical protein BRADI_3g23074v3 [Brachypodium distachyon]
MWQVSRQGLWHQRWHHRHLLARRGPREWEQRRSFHGREVQRSCHGAWGPAKARGQLGRHGAIARGHPLPGELCRKASFQTTVYICSSPFCVLLICGTRNTSEGRGPRGTTVR